ncbi:hypothetical protein [Fusobacterium sp. PH5-44]|uniref:hypothetical protein n=1 Tax=unclassified Fusobacterium TaxID=2648384 RepID=UPI003D258DA6
MMENLDEQVNIANENITTIKEKSKFQGKKWFLSSYLGMMTAFFTVFGLMFSIMNFLLFTPPLGTFFLIFIKLGKIIYIIFLLVAFILGRVLKKRSLYLAKGFTYSGFTIIIITIILYIFFNI